MIIVQDILAKGFNTLPLTDDKKPVYNWGNELHLLKVLELYQKSNAYPYPLIYQVSNTSTQREQSSEATINLELIIATRETRVDLLNENRWAYSYKQLLYPVLINIVTLFMQGVNTFTWNGEYTVREFPNYGNGQENFTIDLWDALRFETTITLNNNCLNTILYDTN